MGKIMATISGDVQYTQNGTVPSPAYPHDVWISSWPTRNGHIPFCMRWDIPTLRGNLGPGLQRWAEFFGGNGAVEGNAGSC